MDETYDVIIIGAGIAGLTAAIYASRQRMSYKILASEFGGAFVSSGEIENYPGIVATTGIDFQNEMEKQMEFNKIKVDVETLNSINKEGEFIQVQTDKGSYLSHTVIIATGSKPKKLNIAGEDKFARKGVTYCSICDGPLFSGVDVAIVGGGNSALEATEFMSKIASKIHLFTNIDRLTGQESLIQNVLPLPNLTIHYNSQIDEIKGDAFVSSISFTEDGEKKQADVKGVIIEIGRDPNTEAFKDFVELDEHRHIIIDCQAKTNIEGVFAAGDCSSGHEYQYIIAAGQGAMALLKVAKYLANKKR